MAAVGKLELKTDKDLEKDAEISLMELFPYTERVKEFALKAYVIRDQTILNIIIAKLFNIDTKWPIMQEGKMIRYTSGLL